MNHEGQDQHVNIGSLVVDDVIQILEHCTICHKTLKNAVSLLPCNHVFDISCIRYWMIAKFPETITCPLCRTLVGKLSANRGKEDEKEVLLSEILMNEEIVAAGRQNSVDLGNLIQSFDIIHWQFLQWQRLAARGPVSVTYEPVEYLSVIAPFEDGIAVVSRHLSLSIKQQDIRTVSTLGRWLKIEYYKPKFTSRFRDLQNRASASSRPAMHKARQEIADLQEEYSEAFKWPNTHSMRWVYQRPDQYLGMSDRGVQGITLLKKARATETPRALQMTSGKTSFSIKWTTRLTEWGPTRPDGDQLIFRKETPQLLRVRQKVRVATEQIRSALEWLRGRSANDQTHQLDRFTTNILELGAPGAVQCLNCPAKHIPGYCLEQWSLKFP
ncbi:hypothetical protein N431DRAFT_342622 [Stipitochalara longipes BDJ]|nr:hypothetical protein N431DRAFT_342622 [Stipitochalara longipes BDJ]